MHDLIESTMKERNDALDKELILIRQEIQSISNNFDDRIKNLNLSGAQPVSAPATQITSVGNDQIEKL